MHLVTATLLFKFAMGVYAVAGAGSLLAFRREKLAALIGFGGAFFAGLCGAMSGCLFLFAGRPGQSVAFELWPSLIPYLHLDVKLDALAAFFVLILSLLVAAVSIYSLGYIKAFYRRKNV